MIVRIKKRTLRELLFGATLLALFLLAIIGVSFNSNPVNAVNITNSTVRTTVNVTNTDLKLPSAQEVPIKMKMFIKSILRKY